MCPPENIHVGGHVAAFGRAHRPSPTVAVYVTSTWVVTCAVTLRHSGGHIGPPLQWMFLHP